MCPAGIAQPCWAHVTRKLPLCRSLELFWCSSAADVHNHVMTLRDMIAAIAVERQVVNVLAPGRPLRSLTTPYWLTS